MEIDTLLDAIGRPRRRANPRIARALQDAEHQMVDGIASWRLGEGPAILFVHGWEDDTSLWGPLLEAALDRGRAVVAFDLPAHGFSQGDVVEIESAATAVASVAQALGPISAVVGHSFGCKAIAFAIAWHGFRPHQVALIGSPTAQRIQFHRMAKMYRIPEDVAHQALAVREARLGFSVDRYDLATLKDAMTMPVLFVHSADDEACAVSDVQAVADVWPAAEMLITDGLGHRLVAQDPDIVAALIAFLDP
ncbi:MAG: alpha/beta fold hydrolase [Caulobacterales bacterium]